MEWQPGDRVIVRGETWRVDRSTLFADCQALDLALIRSGATRTLLLPFDRPRSVPPRRLAVVSRRRWAHQVRRLALSSFPYGGLRFCPPAIRLLPYQLEPVLAFVRHGAIRVLVADDVGLGKTVQAGLVVRELARADHLSRVLIVCPAALREQWAAEMAAHFDLHHMTTADAGWLRRMALELPPDVNPWSLPGIYLASVDFVKRPEALRPLEDVRWDLLVVDEAHLATLGSDRRAAAGSLAARSRRLMLLTATPHSGDDDQFRALCGLGAAPGVPLVFFCRDRSDAGIESAPPRTMVLPVRLSDPELRVHRLLDAYVRDLWQEAGRRQEPAAGLVATLLAKRALSSAASLALSVRRRRALLAHGGSRPLQLPLPLLEEETIGDETADAILQVRGLTSAQEEASRLEAIAVAAEAATPHERKAHALLRLVRRAGEPALIFSEYRDTAARLRDLLCAAGHQAGLLHGGLPHEDRRRAVSDLAAGRTHLVATDAASEGLNLHHGCRLVVHFELPWTPLRLHQRCGRVNRIGQPRRVHEVVFVAQDTSEQLVLAPLLRRAARSGTLARAPLLQHLTESRIAAHVLGGLPLPPAQPSMPEGVVPSTLRAEAVEEAARLELLRRLRRDSPGATRPRTAPVTTVPVVHVANRRSVYRPGLLLVCSVRLREQTGDMLADEIMVLSCGGGTQFPRRRARQLRADVAAALRGLLPQAAPLLQRIVNVRLRTARPLRTLALDLARRHAEHMRTDTRPASEQLVQAGLFHRRALRAAESRRRATQVCEDEGRARGPILHGNGGLEGDYELLAILIAAPG